MISKFISFGSNIK